MSWFVVDDQAFQHPKFQSLLRLDLSGDPDASGAVDLWMRGGSRLKAGHIDGVLDVFDLLQLVPDRGRVLRRAELLVQVRLWHDHEHWCERCPRPGPGRFAYHDWRRYHRPGAIDRAEEAIRAERNSAELKNLVWQRDRLPDGADGVPDGDTGAHCAYCGRLLLRSRRKGDGGHEVDHVVPRAFGLDNLVLACRACNQKKGRQSLSKAGLSLRLTAAHEAALARRGDSSHPSGSAGLAAMMRGVVEPPPLTWVTDPLDEAPDVGLGRSHDAESAGPAAGESSRPTGSAELDHAAGSHDAEFAGLPGPRRLPEPAPVTAPHPGPGSPAPVIGVPVEVFRESSPQGGGSSLLICPQEASQCHAGGPGEAPAGAGAFVAPESACVAPACPGGPDGGGTPDGDAFDAGVAPVTASSLGPSCPHARGPVRGYAPARAQALTGACALAGQGRAGAGQDGAGAGQDGAGAGQGRAGAGQAQGRTGQGKARQGRRRRRGKRRRRSSMGECPAHGDQLPCRACEEEAR